MEGVEDKRITQTYVMYDGKEYFVSTINRESSSRYGGIYAETLVWESARNTKSAMKRGKMVAQDEGSQGSISAHIKMVERIHRTGKFAGDED